MIRALALLLPLCLVVGCRSPGPGISLPAADPRPDALLASLQHRVASRSALRARANLDLDAPDVRLDRPQRLAVARPARMRVEVLGLFDQLAAVVVTNGERYQVYDARSDELEEGLVDAALLWRVARVDLVPEVAVGILLGAPRPDPGLSSGGARLLEDGAIAFARLDARGVQRESYRFDAAGQIAERASFDAQGDLDWRAQFSDYRPVRSPAGPEEPFAHDVLLEFPRVSARAHMVFKQVLLSEELPEALFVLQLPDRSSQATTEPAAMGARITR